MPAEDDDGEAVVDHAAVVAGAVAAGDDGDDDSAPVCGDDDDRDFAAEDKRGADDALVHRLHPGDADADDDLHRRRRVGRANGSSFKMQVKL